MMEKVVGVLAHVDAGKTTLCEGLLYAAGALRRRGRVDHQNAFLDCDEQERRRGITIFSGQAQFSWQGQHFTLVDTPGHTDFAAETERALAVLDCAVVLVDCTAGIQGHTRTLCRLLQKYRLPTFYFLNKCDRPGADPQAVRAALQQAFGGAVVDCTSLAADGALSETAREELAALDEQLMERYFDGTATGDDFLCAARQLAESRALRPCFCGSALQGTGIEPLLHGLALLFTTSYDESAPLGGRVQKVRCDPTRGQLTFIKLLSGTLRPRQPLYLHTAHGEFEEKCGELRLFSGEKSHSVPQATAGQLVAVTGLHRAGPGDGVGWVADTLAPTVTPALQVAVLPQDGLPLVRAAELCRLLEREDPLLGVQYSPQLEQLQLQIMGPIQLEVLAGQLSTRFGARVAFGPCRVLYRETIKNTVVGYGHFEPLRHYAEVHLRLAPGVPGSGITFESACPLDLLDKNYQNLVRTHVFERPHKGVLTGSPLCDVHITLLRGRAHLKHTEGGDFREATYRAIRQGLEQAESVLLEPVYRFTAQLPAAHLGRLLADVQKVGGSFLPPETAGGDAQVQGLCPVAGFMDYPPQLAAYTGGQGSMSLQVDSYRAVPEPGPIIDAIGYDKVRDTENTSDSIFCAKGAGYAVKWDQVPAMIHIKD